MRSPMTSRLHVDDKELSAYFYQMTDTCELSRREALAATADKFGLSPNDVYARLERLKASRAVLTDATAICYRSALSGRTSMAKQRRASSRSGRSKPVDASVSPDSRIAPARSRVLRRAQRRRPPHPFPAPDTSKPSRSTSKASPPFRRTSSRAHRRCCGRFCPAIPRNESSTSACACTSTSASAT